MRPRDALIGGLAIGTAMAILFPATQRDDTFRVDGGVRVIDGDTFETPWGERVRLWGIDAPEAGAPGGLSAEIHLETILGHGAECERVDTDRYGRTVARCTWGGGDVACSMIEAGTAVEWTRYSGGAYRECSL